MDPAGRSEGSHLAAAIARLARLKVSRPKLLWRPCFQPGVDLWPAGEGSTTDQQQDAAVPSHQSCSLTSAFFIGKIAKEAHRVGITCRERRCFFGDEDVAFMDICAARQVPAIALADSLLLTA